FVKAAVLWERLGQKDRALQLYKRAGDQEAVNRFIVERADIRQSQDETVGRLMDHGSFNLALHLAERRHEFLVRRLGKTAYSQEIEIMDEYIRRCKAELAEQKGAWM